MLDVDSAHEVVAALRFDLPLEDYRLRIAPLAEALFSGESRRRVEKRRDVVLPDVWDEALRRMVATDLQRLRRLIDRAEADLSKPPRRNALAHAVVDRIVFEISEHQRANHAAFQNLEGALREAAPSDRGALAAFAMRGAGASLSIPLNEIRSAIVRGARKGIAEADADTHARNLARRLATDDRRSAVRGWARAVATHLGEELPFLAAELQALAAEDLPADPGQDLAWVQTGVGIVFELGLSES
jgi:hypothetical protein